MYIYCCFSGFFFFILKITCLPLQFIDVRHWDNVITTMKVETPTYISAFVCFTVVGGVCLLPGAH